MSMGRQTKFIYTLYINAYIVYSPYRPDDDEDFEKFLAIYGQGKIGGEHEPKKKRHCLGSKKEAHCMDQVSATEQPFADQPTSYQPISDNESTKTM